MRCMFGSMLDMVGMSSFPSWVLMWEEETLSHFGITLGDARKEKKIAKLGLE